MNRRYKNFFLQLDIQSLMVHGEGVSELENHHFIATDWIRQSLDQEGGTDAKFQKNFDKKAIDHLNSIYPIVA